MRKAVLVSLLSIGLIAAVQPPAGEELYREGVAARHAGDHRRAVALLRQLVDAEPGNADAQLQLGLALMAEGRLDEAEAALRRTLAIAPDYADARAALARLEAQRRSTPQPHRWELDLDASYSALEGGRPDWREGAVQLRHHVDPRTTIGGTLEASRRFGLRDVYGELRIDHRLADGASFYLSAGGTPDADFRPEWQLGAGGAVRVAEGPAATVLTLDARQARFRAGDIQTVSPGVEQYVAGGRAWITARWINIFDEAGRHRSGWLARGDLMANDRLRLFAGLADAPDVSEGVVTDTFTIFGGAAVDLDARTTLRLSVAREDRVGGGDRTQFGIGMGVRF
ncbi:MAG: YaiO family outer membrane beta-barrel protein [Allosphingosinicella sp.]|uniref:YaiO family outer membrane beta-barrel protein n=1 Tax=Allosphingosinicella sp. TaxID=2823234 RepID=UPI00392A81C0